MAKPGQVIVNFIGDASSFNKVSSEVSGKLTTFGGKASSVFKGVAVAGTAVVTALSAIGAGLLAVGTSADAAYDNLIVGTGAAGVALEGLKGSMETVARTTPSSFGEVSVAIADLNTRLDLTGAPLEDMATRMLNLSRLTKTDLSTNIAGVSRVFGDWGVATEDQAETLDKLFAATQGTGIGLARLTDLSVQFGSPLRQMGFTMESTMAMFGKFEKEGVNVETVMAGMRMGLANMARAGEEPVATFGRLVEEIKTTGDASAANLLSIEAFGSRAGPDMAAAIREGRFELDEMIGMINDSGGAVQDATDRTSSWQQSWQLLKNRAFIAIMPVADKVFAKVSYGMSQLLEKAEPFFAIMQENMPAILQVVNEVWWTIIDVVSVVVKTAIDIISTFVKVVGEFWEEHSVEILAGMRSIWETVQEIWPKVVAIIKGAIELAAGIISAFVTTAMALWDKHKDTLIQAVSDIWDTIQVIWPGIQETITNAVDSILVIVGDVIAIVVELWEQFGDDILAFVEKVWPHVQAFIESALMVIQGIVKLVLAVIKGDWGAAWDAIKMIVQGVWDNIKSRIGIVIEIIKTLIGGLGPWILGIAASIWNPMKTKAVEIFDAIVTLVVELPGRITALVANVATAAFGIGKSIIDGISDGISGAVGFVSGLAAKLGTAMKSWINTNVIDKLNDIFEFTVPVKFAPDIHVNAPDIPHLARGGSFSPRQATLAVIGEGPFTEVAAPEPTLRRIFREEAQMMPGGANGISIGTINMNTNSSASDLTEELRWLVITGGV